MELAGALTSTRGSWWRYVAVFITWPLALTGVGMGGLAENRHGSPQGRVGCGSTTSRPCDLTSGVVRDPVSPNALLSV